MRKNIFVPIQKVDIEKREVWGVLAEEAPDKMNEIFDYASSVPFFKAWNEQFSKATDGQSLGNLRSMHGKIAAGKFIDFAYNDSAKNISVGAKVVDDNEWQKVVEGVYTGFSVGGKYVKTWNDGIYTRYTANPVEGSLVDNPCMYGATFSAVKGAETEMRKFVGSEETRAMSKAMIDVYDMAGVVSSLRYLYGYVKTEADLEGDKSKVPGRIKKALKELASILADMAQEEASELLAEIDQLDKEEGLMAEKSTQPANEGLTLEGLGKKFDALQTSLDLVVKSLTKAAEPPADDKVKQEAKEKEEAEKAAADKGQQCANKGAESTDLNKALGDTELVKGFNTRFAALEASLDTVSKAIGNVTEAFQKFLDQPAPSKVLVNGAAVEKAADTQDLNKGAGTGTDNKQKPEDVVKSIHASGPQFRSR